VSQGERDPSHFIPELSRRARGFATFAMLRHLGRDGIAEMIEWHSRLARLMADILGGEEDVAVANEVVLNQAIVRFGANQAPEKGDDLTLKTIAAVQKDGTCFAGGTPWQGRWVMLLLVIGGGRSEADAMRSARAIADAWRGVRSRR
jgi:glutamate/tyrosine decarboxylase-like PLP-dependent enzyme